MFRHGSVLQPRDPRDRSDVRLSWLSWSGVLLLAFLLLDFILLSIWGYGGDWSPLWVAGHLAWRHPSSLYDFAEITRLQLPILGNLGVRPFVYPPTTLILATPLSFLPFWVSLACVSIGGSLCLALVSSRSETNRILLLVSPPILFAAMIGQPTLIVAALTVMGLSQLKSNEARAGFLLGLAAMLKPTLLLMVPFGLVAGRHWRAAVSGAATAAALSIVSILLLGFSPWLAWIGAVARFREIFDGAVPLYRNGITPYALALRLGIETDWIAWTMLPVAILSTLAIFVRSQDWRTRMVAVIGGSLLVSPYAMNYELAALAPVVLTMRRERLIDLVIPLIWAGALFANASLLGLLAVYSWALVSAFRGTRSAAEDVEPPFEVPTREIRGSIA